MVCIVCICFIFNYPITQYPILNVLYILSSIYVLYEMRIKYMRCWFICCFWIYSFSFFSQWKIMRFSLSHLQHKPPLTPFSLCYGRKVKPSLHQNVSVYVMYVYVCILFVFITWKMNFRRHATKIAGDVCSLFTFYVYCVYIRTFVNHLMWRQFYTLPTSLFLVLKRGHTLTHTNKWKEEEEQGKRDRYIRAARKLDHF